MDSEMYDNYRMQDALIQSQGDEQRVNYAPQIYQQVQEQEAVLVKQTNPKVVVEAILLRLQGKMMTDDGEIRQVSTPVLNKEGISDIWFILDSFVNDNFRLTHLNDQQIANMMFIIGKDLDKQLSMKWKMYGLDKKHLDMVSNSILCNIYSVLNRAREQNEKNWLGRMSIEQIKAGGGLPAPKKEGFFSKLKL